MKQIKALVEGVWKEFEPDELKGKSGVYKWTSPDGFWYVGQSCDLYRRHREFMNFAGDYSGELVNLCDESKIRLYDDLVNKNFSNNTPNPLDTRIPSDVLNNIVNSLDRDYTIFEDDIDYVKFIDVFTKCLDYIKQINNQINNQNK